MRCPFCKNTSDRVVDSRTSQDGASVRRRRKCLGCKRRFTTYERVEMIPRMVIKKNGDRESFNRAKILRGIAKACDKRNIPLDRLEELVDRVEAQVYDQYEREAPAHAIGELVSNELKELDQVAYVRFASVYRRFEDISGFEKVLSALLRKDSASGAHSSGGRPGARTPRAVPTARTSGKRGTPRAATATSTASAWLISTA